MEVATAPAETLYTKAEAAAYLKLSTNTVDRLMKSEQIPYKKFGKSVRFTKEALDNYNTQKPN
jgi:excisionase family DNA binding protein